MDTLVILKVSMELPDANVENVNAQETLIWALSETATEQLGNVSDVSMIQPDSIVRNVKFYTKTIYSNSSLIYADKLLIFMTVNQLRIKRKP